MKFYVIYKITNKINDKKYIGCHITEEIDDGYMGSGKLIKLAIQKYGIENFEKEIMYYCDGEEEMIKKEEEIVNKDIVKSNEYYNLKIGGNSGWYYINNNLDKYRYHFKNKVVVKDTNNNILKVSNDDPSYLSGELKSIAIGYVTVKDDVGNFYRVKNDDERYLSGELKGINKGLILAKDENDKILLIDKNDKDYLSGKIKPFWCGKKHKEETKEKMRKSHKNKHNGVKNSQYGTCWIYNKELKENKKIKKEELNKWLLDGWLKGRKINY